MKHWIVGLGCLLGLLLPSCQALEPTLQVGPEKQGQSVELVVGQSLLLTLPANPTTGYQWQLRMSASPVLEQIGAAQYTADPAPTGMVGRGGQSQWRFRAVSPGLDRLQLVYVRPWQPEQSAQEFELIVQVR